MSGDIEVPVFLGVCESTLIRGDGVSQDFYGVGEILPMVFFPVSLSGIYLLIGLPRGIVDADEPVRFIVRNTENPEEWAHSDLNLVKVPVQSRVNVTGFGRHFSSEETGGRKSKGHLESDVPLLLSPNTLYKLIPIPCPPLFVREPCEIGVFVNNHGSEVEIGTFRCVFCPTQPISEEERTAILSRPGAVQGVVYSLTCNQCGDRVEFYLPLKVGKKPPMESHKAMPLSAAPDEWKCKCEKSRIQLAYLKQGLHEVFRRVGTIGGQKEAKFIPMYQRGAIAAIIGEYEKLLNNCPGEEEQFIKFFQEHPIVWNFLGANKIWKKPSILTKYKTDFAVLTMRNILYLVEIEKPITKLVKSNGGIHSELQAGIDQIRNWRTEVEKRREAVLDGLGLGQSTVHDIRYILIAGMASKTSMDGLEKVRKMKTDADFIFCFDELASYLHLTETALSNI